MSRTAAYEVKGSAFRGYVTQIEKLGALAEVRARVPPETLAALETPPLPSVWIDAIIVEDLIGALEAARGLDAVRAVTKNGQQGTMLPVVRPILTGLLRLFGATPATLLARFPDFTRTVQRGIQFRWESESPRAGRLVVTFGRPHVPRHAFIGMESACWLILDLCGLKGTVAPTEISSDGTSTSGKVPVRW